MEKITQWEAAPPPRFAPSLNVCRKRDFDRYLESLCPHQPTRRLLVQRLTASRALHTQTVQVGRAGTEELLVWSTGPDRPLPDAAAVAADLAAANSVLHLVHTIRTLEAEEQQLKARLAAGRDECRRLLRDGRKDKALLAMRRAKAIEAVMDERRQQLANLDRMLIQVQMVGSNKQVLEAFKVARDWFKSSRVADSHTAAHEALGDIQDALDEHKELTDALAYNPAAAGAASGAMGGGFDDSELELELDQLLAEDAAAAASPAPAAAGRKLPQPSELDNRFSELDVDSLHLPEVADLPLPQSPSVSFDELRERLDAL